jgi:RecG-like helicase
MTLLFCLVINVCDMQSWVLLQSVRTPDVLCLKMAGGVYRNCQLLSMTLNEVGFENVALHAMIRQKERLAALTQFRSNIIRILIATDVASRGRCVSLYFMSSLFLAIQHTLIWF